MPFYEFECVACKLTWEKDLPMSKSKERPKCPKCHKKANRIFGGVSFRVVGGTREQDPSYKLNKAIGRAKDERMEWRDKHPNATFKKQVGSDTTLEKRRAIDPEQVTVLGNMGKNDADQIFDNID